MECLRKLFFSCRKPEKPLKDNQVSPSPATDRTLNITPILNNTTFSTPYPGLPSYLTKIPSTKSLARVHSHKDVSTIQVTSEFSIDSQSNDYRVKENKTIRYNCPICLKYYDTILVTKCCNNYICHFCIDQMNEKTANEEKVEITNCPFCECKSLILDDVDPEEKLKRYSDSPASTFGGGKPFLKENFRDIPRESPEVHSQRPGNKHKYSKSINSFFGTTLFSRRKSEGTIDPDFVSTEIIKGAPIIDAKGREVKKKPGATSSDNEEEEAIKIVSERKLKSAMLPALKSPRDKKENCDTLRDSQNTQI